MAFLDSSRASPLLHEAASVHNSQEKADALYGLASPSSARGVMRPRPEIILRWKRFLLLVMIGAAAICVFTVTLLIGIPIMDVEKDDAEDKVELYNSYSGVIMGFVESFVGQLLGYLFPVFIVYLHNIKWYRGDDPANRLISKKKKIALVLFFPLVMIAIGNSLSAVQTNQIDDNDGDTAATRGRRLADAQGGVLDTPIRSALTGMNHLPQEQQGGDALGLARVAAGTRVALSVTAPDWADEMPVAQQATAVEITDQQTLAQAESVVPISTVAELLLHGSAVFDQVAKEGGVAASVNASRLHGIKSSPADAVVSAVREAFGAVGATRKISVERRVVQERVQQELLSIEIALTSAPNAMFCGSKSCVAASSDPLVRLRPTIATTQFCTSSDFSQCDADLKAAFMFGSVVSASHTNGAVKYSMKLTFSKLEWTTNADLCGHETFSTEALTCSGLSLLLPQSRRHLVLPASLSPVGRLPSVSSPLRIAQLIQPPVVIDNGLLALNVVKESDASHSTSNPSVDAFAAFLHSNQLSFEDLSLATHAASLVFLFQHARLTSPASSPAVAWQRHLATMAVAKEYEIYFANTGFGSIATWIACGILFILSALVLLVPNARARLYPPKGGNARAERFIAVQTEEIYPNLVYKKRFRIGKTGEKIKFREFGVEAVTLHHVMEEDEQIEL